MSSTVLLRTACSRASAPAAQRQRLRAPVCAVSSRDNGGGSSGDTRLALVSALLGAAGVRATSARDGALDWLQSSARFLAQLLEPFPPGFPPGPAGDAALELASGPLAFIERAARQHGGAVGLRLAGARAVLVSDAALAASVLIEDADSYTKRGTAFFPGSALVGEGLLVSDGDVWRRQRRLSAPAFRASAVATYAAAMGQAAVAMTSPGGAWAISPAPTVRDVYPDFNEVTLRIVAQALFGADVRGAAAEEINSAIAEAFGFFARRAAQPPLPEWLPTLDNVRFGAAVTRLDAAVFRLITTRRRAHVSQGGPAREPADLLDRLLLSHDESGAGMSDAALRDELMTLLVAGQETSAILLTWACTFLAQHPEAAERVAEEATAVLGATRAPDAADYPRLHQTTAVIWETMRLLPPAYLVGRCAARDMSLGPHRIPKGTTILVSPYLLHRSPQHWPDAERFSPQRWLDEAGQAHAAEAMKGMGAHDAYIPFGAGPRNCIGAGFALMEAVLVLASLCRAVKLAVPPGEQPPQTAALITLRPAAARLQITPRAAVGHESLSEAAEPTLVSAR